MRRFVLALALVAAALASPRPARAQTVDIKLGTLAPKGSTWEVLLKELGQKWHDASGGSVNLKIFAGGVLGNEGDMVRKMRVGQLQAAALTTIGMHDITPDPEVLDAPMVIQSYEELDYVMSKMEPKLQRAIESKGYVVLAWSEVGFVRFFSGKKIQKPDDRGAAKLFAWEGDPEAVEAIKAGGFHPVVLSATDIMPSLQTGMIDTVATPPLYALTARIHSKAPKMLDLQWAMLTGATVVKKDVWDRVPGELQKRLLEISRAYGRRLTLEVRRMNEDALKTMKAQGLEVVPVVDLAGWQTAADAANAVVRGKMVPAALFDEMKGYCKEFRAKHGK